MQNGVV
jgi:ABC transporter transmembrane region